MDDILLLIKVLHKGLESLVLNRISKPGKYWLKMKKDYLFDGKMADAADLEVLGGWFGNLKQFLQKIFRHLNLIASFLKINIRYR